MTEHSIGRDVHHRASSAPVSDSACGRALAGRLLGSRVDCEGIQSKSTAVEVKSVTRRMYEDGCPSSLDE